MSTISQERDAIATSLGAIAGLQPFASFPGQVSVTCAVVRRRRTGYGQGSFTGGRAMTYGVDLFIQVGDMVSAQALMDEFLAETGDQSVIAALREDPGFGGAVQSSVVTDVSEDGVFTNEDNVKFLTTTINVAVVSH